MKIAVVAGESSGDYLGGELLKALNQRLENPLFFGIGGPSMQAQGLESRYLMQSISVMGLDDLAHRVIDILKIRRQLAASIIDKKPDVFIGIDVPDFNLGLENRLRKAGIKVVHYVSPTVWAWRSYRMKKISRSVDLMLTLFPFEKNFYKTHDVPVEFVGHPIIDELESLPDSLAARKTLNIGQGLLVAIMPGSRHSEINKLGRVFFDTAARLYKIDPTLKFVLPAANQTLYEDLRRLLKSDYPELPLKLVLAQSRQCLVAADVALLASGTAALESALIGTPMVVAYKVSAVTEWLFRFFSKVRVYSMPNHLLDKPIIPEFVQKQVTVENLSREITRLLYDQHHYMSIKNTLKTITKQFGNGASNRAADAVVKLINNSVLPH